METTNIYAQILSSFPAHLWVFVAAAVITFFGLAWAEKSWLHGDKIKWATYILLIVLVVIPNGYLALFPPAPDTPFDLVAREPSTNYEGLFYLDAFLALAGWGFGLFVRSKT